LIANKFFYIVFCSAKLLLYAGLNTSLLSYEFFFPIPVTLIIAIVAEVWTENAHCFEL